MRENHTSESADGGPIRCRFCGEELRHTFVDLGMSPLANSYLRRHQLRAMEPFYPLHAYVCANCLLVQLEEFESPENIFSDYAYFSSYSGALVVNARAYAHTVIGRYGLGSKSKVVEIASNDGYLLQFFVENGIPVLGIEPAANVAQAAIAKGVPTRVQFFTTEAARAIRAERSADLIIANNVLAHVPNLNDFVEATKLLLSPRGIVTMEFPHLLLLVEGTQFDTIYHEHFSYFSLRTAAKIFLKHGLRIIDVEEISTHGGSLRIHACHAEDTSRQSSDRVDAVLLGEASAGFDRLERYLFFSEQVKAVKCKFLSFVAQAKQEGKSIAGYGAAAKGNTFLNYCGVGPDFIDFVVDQSPHKQGCYLPGTHIPVHHPNKVFEARPDYLLILAWNLKAEIVPQMARVRDWGGKFVTCIPDLEVI
jgi:2-polyprenyl-3-methyl-5-hydroxy-6-metoxy-1,4-benzoquinol methylase